MSQPDFLQNLQSQYRHESSNIIFEQPTKEDEFEDTYPIKTDNTQRKREEVLKTEDLTTMGDQANTHR